MTESYQFVIPYQYYHVIYPLDTLLSPTLLDVAEKNLPITRKCPFHHEMEFVVQSCSGAYGAQESAGSRSTVGLRSDEGQVDLILEYRRCEEWVNVVVALYENRCVIIQKSKLINDYTHLSYILRTFLYFFLSLKIVYEIRQSQQVPKRKEHRFQWNTLTRKIISRGETNILY